MPLLDLLSQERKLPTKLGTRIHNPYIYKKNLDIFNMPIV